MSATRTQTDPQLWSAEQREAVLADRARRKTIQGSCSRRSVCGTQGDLDRTTSLDALAAKYLVVAQMRSAAKLLLATLMGLTADELRKRVNEVHGPSFDAACAALWDVVNDDNTAIVPTGTAVELVPSVFTRPGGPGDFAWMIERPEYADSLFVFNDNETSWRGHRAGGYGNCHKGGGNAVIRPYQCVTPPRAVGIPTGDKGAGYTSLTASVLDVLGTAVEVVRGLLATGRYKRLIYSAADESGDLGTGIFEVHPDVRRYIVDQLRSITGKAGAA